MFQRKKQNYAIIRFTSVALFSSLLILLTDVWATEGKVALAIGYLKQEQPVPAALSNLDPVPEDLAIQGLRLAIQDNNTTGQFTGQSFLLKEVSVPVGGDVIEAFKGLLQGNIKFVVTSVAASAIRELAPLAIKNNALVLDVETLNDELRVRDCSANVLYFRPSRAMRADALAQVMLKKRWKDWFLVVGPSEQDRLYAAAIKRAAKRYGMTVVAEKIWGFSHDARRTAQSEVPVFTQGVDYDILVVADEEGLFGEYLAYRTWLPRPIAGTQGLVPTAWHKTHEQWGAVQLQNRFRKQANRWMAEQDYAAWLAGRAIGEAAARSQSADFEKIKSFMLSDGFALAGFKGKKLSFRPWSGQLRQPVLLAGARALVAVAPLEGFIHPRNELDSLGYDEAESKCGHP